MQTSKVKKYVTFMFRAVFMVLIHCVTARACVMYKKILVKEVKTLRSQLESSREERDLYYNQLQAMRDALLGAGMGGGNGGAVGRMESGTKGAAREPAHQRSVTEGGSNSRSAPSSGHSGSSRYYTKNPSIFN